MASKSASGDLDAHPDPKHFSYRFLGFLSWGVLAACCLGLAVDGRLVLDAARGLALYMMVRLVLFTFFYLGGLAAIHRAGRRSAVRSGCEPSAGEGIRRATIHHLVIVPNYDEPPEILGRTLEALGLQEGARRAVTVVLGMEAREPGARAKARALQARFADRFHNLMATYHPSDLPGELQGKATNATWAVRRARRELVDRLGILPERIVVTVADSDSVLHPGYLAEIARRFDSDPRRYSRVWQPPILFDRDIWRAHPAVRLATFFTNAISLGDYHTPWEARSLYSTYSISLMLLEEIGYWDPALIAEDVTLFMRAFLETAGRVGVQRIYLPVHANPVYGADLRHAAAIFYAQKLRHGLGGAEIGLLLQKWARSPSPPLIERIRRLLKLVHDHLFFSTAGFVVALGTLLSILLDRTAVITAPPAGVEPLPFVILNALGGAALAAVWLTERVRLGLSRENWRPAILIGEAASFALFPVLFLLLFNLPGLHAQTRMLMGRPFYYERTPKWLDSKIGD
jgi:hypothetical protein